MKLDPHAVSSSALGSLSSCLVDGDPEQLRRERIIRRRALLVSVVLQVVILAGLILFPLLGRSEHIAYRPAISVPYARLGNHQAEPQRPRGQTRVVRMDATFYQPAYVPDHIDTTAIEDPGPGNDVGFVPGSPTGTPDGIPNVIGVDTHPVKPPIESNSQPRKPERVRITSIEPAMLIRRIEPVYPPLAHQLRHEGRVVVHAIIGTDGTIQSMQVLVGDPLLVRSTLDAVGQWRYKPTILNGQAVEVDTEITVNYTLSH